MKTKCQTLIAPSGTLHPLRTLIVDDSTLHLSNGGACESAWCVTMLSAVLVLAAALGTLAGLRASFFFLSQLKGAFSFMGSGVLLLVTLANVTAVLLVAFSWLWSFWPRRRFTKSMVG